MSEDAQSPQAPRPRRRGLLIGGLVLALLALGAILAVGLGNQDDVAESPAAPTGSLAQPPFEPFPAPPLEGVIAFGAGAGSPFALAEMRGKPVVINFWASWCDPCRREAPDLVEFAASHPDVAMLGVDVQDGEEQARAFAGDLGFKWPTVRDPGGATMQAFRIMGLPATFVVDAAGMVVFRKLGTVSAEELREAVRR